MNFNKFVWTISLFLSFSFNNIVYGSAAMLTSNQEVLKIANSFPDGGGYDRKWSSSGVPKDLYFKNERIYKKSTSGTYCCAFTFAVMFEVAKNRGLLKDLSVGDVKKLKHKWFGADVSANTKIHAPVRAMMDFNIGNRVDNPELFALPGDFILFWRQSDQISWKNGHSVIFLGWVEENGEKIGIKYRSSQRSSKISGIGDKIEYFFGAKGKKGRLNWDRIVFSRLF